MYTAQMKELIKKVEATRSERLGVQFERMTPQEKEEVLQENHPDYKEENFRELRLGKNKGDKVPLELADLIEAKSRLENINIDLSKTNYDVDVLIIGGGGAGTAAALEATKKGAKVLLATKLRFGDANTIMAEGGIQAADKPEDSPAKHYIDVMGGGHFTNIPELVEALVKDAPEVIKWLNDFGVMFDKENDGRMITTHGGGTSIKRMHAAADYTGAEIMRVLRDEAINRDIEVVEFSPAVELLLDDEGKAAGAVLYNLETEEYLIAKAKTVILATGGAGRLHYQGFPTSNHYGATADGLVLGYRAGAKLIFADTIQYHPTGVAYPPQIFGALVTEKVRSIGATPLNIDGEQFVYHLETRDVEASAIIRECQIRKKGIKTPSGVEGVWLDTPLIDMLHGEGTLEKRVPGMLRMYQKFGIDMRKEPILVYPTLHYQNGGILINEHGETNVENLYVAGETSGGVHGNNRLMGNSLLDILVFGRRAGAHAGEKSKNIKVTGLSLEHINTYHKSLEENNIKTQRVAPMLLPQYTHRR
ncbi:succinate dehydrogenase / fumarate reductase flavoprotein subunit [Acetoanaerobium pronyense]|uniref:Succinate dehydrogenase / fumarate reductase flavoprotein subunit n=1 Tax=Acetoanaerobium pronyense TaxID=1482736 RepID=A0ABS4KKP6_9FIRM|nr:FAD-dependent oxidoreductase [Acetoanaerobium pronyense]MBP2028367.1 succinate dehydrogenase / fumarate reductase flavoprotein subunit [Acetoanaerobium pronyense]